MFDLPLINCNCYKHNYPISSFVDKAYFRDGRLRVGDEILMVNSVGLLGMTLSDANKAIKKLPYGPIRVVFCSKLVSYQNFGVTGLFKTYREYQSCQGSPSFVVRREA